MKDKHKHFSRILPSDQEWFTPKEVARLIGRTDQHVRDCFDNGRILGHLIHGRSGCGLRKRRSYQVHRDAIVLFLLETANYEPIDFAERVEQLLLRCSRKDMQRLCGNLAKN